VTRTRLRGLTSIFLSIRAAEAKSASELEEHYLGISTSDLFNFTPTSKDLAQPLAASDMDTHQSHTGEFDSLLDLETQFYSTGWNSGFPHGELHGLFEGRELGREKSWELWEEIGYYQGVARLWKVILKRQGKESTR